MLSTAMKAPSVAPITAIQVFVGIAAPLACGSSAEEAALRVGCSAVIGGASCSDEWRMRQAACFDNPGSYERIVQRGLIVVSGHGRLLAFGRLTAVSETKRARVSRSARTVALVLTVGTADMPGRSRPFRRWSSSTILTGTRADGKETLRMPFYLKP